MWIILLIAAFFLYLYLKDSKNENNRTSNEFSLKYKDNQSSSNFNKSKNYGSYSRDFSVTSLVDKNEIFIKDAILHERKIHFKYRDKDKNLTERTVTPLKLFIHNFGDDGEMLCLEAFCHLRNANRTFALFRINSLKMI
jgi:hypothetical protein